MNVRLGILFLVLVSLLVLPHALLAASFEGVIDCSLTNEEGTKTMSYSFKGDRIRVDVGGAGMPTSVIIDLASKKSTILMPSMNMYMEHDMTASATKPGTESTITNTGRTETILGHNCEIWLSGNTDGTTEERWLATDINAFFALGGNPSAQRVESAFDRMVKEKGMFPLKSVKRKGDVVVSSMETTRVDAHTVEASLFEVPAGFQKMSIPTHSR